MTRDADFHKQMCAVADERQPQLDKWTQVVENLDFLRGHLVSVMEESVKNLKPGSWDGWAFGPSFPGNEQAERDLKWAAGIVRAMSAVRGWAVEQKLRKANELAVLRGEASKRNPYPLMWG